MSDLHHAVRGNRKERVGEVLASQMAKTIIVRVERRFPHPPFRKVVTQYKKYYAHDEKGESREGDVVMITPCRPLSRRKSWRHRRRVIPGICPLFQLT